MMQFSGILAHFLVGWIRKPKTLMGNREGVAVMVIDTEHSCGDDNGVTGREPP